MRIIPFICKWPLLIAILTGFIGFFATGLDQLITWQIVTDHYTEINQFTQQHWLLSYTALITLYILTTAFSLPIASLLTLAAGAIFGWPAIGAIVLAATAGASVVFIAARGFFQNWLRARAEPFFTTVESGFINNAFNFLLFLRLIPLAPFWAVNIIPAFTRMKLMTFVVATAIGIIPGTSVYVAVGRGLHQAIANGNTPDFNLLSNPNIWLPLTALSVFALLPILYRQRINKIKSKGTRLNQ